MALTNRQKALLGLINQIASPNAAGNTGLNTDFSVGLPGLDVDFDVNFGGGGGDSGTNTCPPNSPTTLRELLCSLVNEQVQVTTPFDTVTGTLIAVKSDYIVIVESSGAQVLVRIEKIELVSEL